MIWTLGAGNVLTWEIAENGKTILTGSAQMGIAGKTQALFDDEPETVKDGTYTAVMELKNGNVVKWSYLEPGSKTTRSGGGIQAAPQESIHILAHILPGKILRQERRGAVGTIAPSRTPWDCKITFLTGLLRWFGRAVW